MVTRIKGHVTAEMLKDAFVKVQQRHALLQVRIQDDKNHDQWFTSDKVQEIPVENPTREVEMHPKIYGALEWDRLIMQPGRARYWSPDRCL